MNSNIPKCLSVQVPIQSDRQTPSNIASIAKRRLDKILANKQQVFEKKDSCPQNLNANINSITSLDSILQDNLQEIINNVSNVRKDEDSDAVTISKPIRIDAEHAKLINAWITQALEECHIEPSQACVGRIVGWPVRSFAKNSLLVDFNCCCMQKGLPQNNKRDQDFLNVLDQILEPQGNRYEFPPLSECRQRYQNIKTILRQENAT